MKSPAFEYVVPGNVEEALRYLSEFDNARVLAGGQSLLAMLNMRFAFPDCLVDINFLNDLSYIQSQHLEIELGAMTRQRDVEFSDVVADQLPILKEAILHVGHRQTRNRGTVGGSLCQLDPSAEIPTIAMAMDAKVIIGSIRGQRVISMAQFPAGYMTPALEPDEMVLGVSMRPWDRSHGYGFDEFSRRHGDFAMASAAVMVQFGKDGLVLRASVTLGGVASAPVRMQRAEEALLQTRATPEDLAHVAMLCGEIEAMTDSYVPGWYRQQLARVLVRRALEKAVSRAEK